MKTLHRLDPEYYFLNELFGQLKLSSVRYAVMRNYETLPYSTGGSDLDILIHPQDYKRTKKVILKTLEKVGGVLIGKIETVGWFSIFAIGKNEHKGNIIWWGVVLDIFYKGILYKGAAKLIDYKWEMTRNHNGISVFGGALAAVIGMLKEMLYNNALPLRYMKSARAAARFNWNDIKPLLKPMGDEAIDIFRQLLFNVKNTNSLKKCNHLRASFLEFTIKSSPLKYLCGRILFEWSKIQRYLSPSGIVIAILGVDGAGKSTIIESIKPILNAATHRATYVQHLRPGLLPPLARLKGKVKEPAGPVLDPHGSTPSGVLISIVRLSYLTLDYIFGYWVKVRPKIAKQPAIFLYDRYAYDMMIDPKRFRIGLSGQIVEWFTKIAPKPDIIICLYAPPKIIFNRKKELPINEIERQVDAIKKYANNEPRAVLISTEGNIRNVRDRVLLVLIKYWKKKFYLRAYHGKN